MSYFTQISYGDSGSLDAFQRLRISKPENLFSTQSAYKVPDIQMESTISGTGVAPSFDSNVRMNLLSCTAGSGVCSLQTYQYFPYEPGKSQYIAMTFVAGSGTAAVTKDFGYFDADNGIFFRQNGVTNLQLVRRSKTSGSVVDDTIAQSSWNLDKFDGSGASGITLDVTKAQILIIDLQFLGMGRVRVGFDINGLIYYCHEWRNANILSVPYMQTATLPVQILVTATSSATTGSCYFKCSSVQSEGGITAELGYRFCTPEGTVTAANGARTHILSIRPKTTFNSITNRSYLIPGPVDLIVTGNNPIYYEIVLGATFSGAPTWADVDTARSAFEYGVNGTFSALTSGTVISSGYISSSNSVKGALEAALAKYYPIALNRAGANFPMGTLSVLVTGIGGTSATRCSLCFLEIR